MLLEIHVPVKILITTFTYCPNKDGVAEACRVMAEGLATAGWQVQVATSMGNRWDDVEGPHEIINGVQITHFNLGGHPKGSEMETEQLRTFASFVKAGDFDVVVNQCWDVLISLWSRKFFDEIRAKRVLVSHGAGAHMYEWQARPTMGLGRWLRGVMFTFRNLPLMLRGYHQVIFLSERADLGRFFDHAFASWTDHPDIQVVANGIDLGRFGGSGETFRETHGIGNAPMALCVANYSERKNQRRTIRSFRSANVDGSVLVCIGSELNDYSKGLMELDRRLAMKGPNCSVLFLEKLSRDETFSAFQACDVFLLAAKVETQPIVLIEAMAASKPWISIDSGCISEMAGGLVCRSNKSLVSAIRELFGNPGIRAELGARGRKEAELRYDAKANVRRYDELFRNLIGQA